MVLFIFQLKKENHFGCYVYAYLLKKAVLAVMIGVHMSFDFEWLNDWMN